MPVLRARSAKEGHALVEALMAGGITVMEVTMTVPGAVGLLRELKKHHGDKLLLGSGTVTDAAQAEETIDSGAEFVVSPSFHPEVVEKTKKLGKVSIPGSLTPTEVITAWRAGADYVKIFPCSAVGGASLSQGAARAVPSVTADSDRRRHAADRSGFSQRRCSCPRRWNRPRQSEGD